MNLLYVTGACLTKNTSANMSHNAFIKGFLECGCDVDIVMAEESWGVDDCALPRWNEAQYYTYRSVSFADRIRGVAKQVESHTSAPSAPDPQNASVPGKTNSSLRAHVKKLFYCIFKPDPVYPLDKKWLHTARSFFSDKKYDLVISNSSPASSHRLVVDLIRAGRIHYDRWIQIWEDPWYFDLYGGHSDVIRAEEHLLLREASEVVYVSPLTLKYQKEYFPDCAEKMTCVPLPYFALEEQSKETSVVKTSFGYFGDYYAKTRNLIPFYDALRESGYPGYIYGDSDLSLPGTASITVLGRVTLDVLAEVQSKTDILVHLCNLKGGQIPGKIYHYSSTNKPILFILDGTEEEIDAIYSFFAPFQRYVFCRNDAAEIREAMKRIVGTGRTFTPVQAFSPASVAERILTGNQTDIKGN